MHKINLNADLREVLKRLAGKRNAGVAQVAEPLIRNEKGGSSSDPTGPILMQAIGSNFDNMEQ